MSPQPSGTTDSGDGDDPVGADAGKRSGGSRRAQSSVDEGDRGHIGGLAERLRGFADQSPIGIVYVDHAGRCHFANKRLCEMLGRSPESLIGPLESWTSSIHPEDRDRMFAEGWKAAVDGTTFESECRIVQPGGRVVWTQLWSVADKRSDGRTAGYIGMVNDITERKRAGEVLEMVAAGVSSATGGNFLRSLVFHLAQSLEAEYSFLGRLADGRADRIVTMAVCDHGRTVENFAYDLAGAPCERVLGQRLVCYRDGVRERFPADELLAAMGVESYAGIALVDSEGKTLGLLSVMDSVPFKHPELVESTLEIFAARAAAELEREEAQRELAAQHEELEELVERRTVELLDANSEFQGFCHTVAHDLRGPLRSMDGFSLQLLERYGARLDNDAQDALRRVRAASQRMGRLIDDLLGLARVARGRIHREQVDLSALAQSIVDELCAAEGDRRVSSVIESGVRAVGDRGLVHDVLRNLIGNAWKFSRASDPARIEFGSCDSQGRRCFFVRDNGAGFDMAYVGKLFAPFERLHDVSEFEGSGIGLATVEKIVRRHGGRVWAESAIGHGATFYFTLDADSGGGGKG